MSSLINTVNYFTRGLHDYSIIHNRQIVGSYLPSLPTTMGDSLKSVESPTRPLFLFG